VIVFVGSVDVVVVLSLDEEKEEEEVVVVGISPRSSFLEKRLRWWQVRVVGEVQCL